MKVLGYVNRFSRGVYRVQKELTENGNGEAFFDFSLITAFRVTEKVSEKYFEAGFGTNATQETTLKHPETTQEKEDTALEKPKKSQRKAKKKPEKSQRNIHEEILDKIRSNPQTTTSMLAKILNRSQDSTRYHLRQLTNSGVIKHEGSTKAGKWIILSE